MLSIDYSKQLNLHSLFSSGWYLCIQKSSSALLNQYTKELISTRNPQHKLNIVLLVSVNMKQHWTWALTGSVCVQATQFLQRSHRCVTQKSGWEKDQQQCQKIAQQSLELAQSEWTCTGHFVVVVATLEAQVLYVSNTLPQVEKVHKSACQQCLLETCCCQTTWKTHHILVLCSQLHHLL